MTKHVYGAVIREDRDGGYWAEVPDLPECFGQGDDFMTAVESISDGVETHLAALESDGADIPPRPVPSPLLTVPWCTSMRILTPSRSSSWKRVFQLQRRRECSVSPPVVSRSS